MKLYIYDLETYPNCFLFCGSFEDQDEVQTFEISSRRNDRDALMSWLSYLQNVGVEMVGFNSLSFDYPILHELLGNQWTFDEKKASHLASQIIGSQTYGNNPNQIRLQERIIPQIDLVKVNHFDNANKRTSLKSLQFAMRSPSVEDLPFDIRDLTHEEMDVLRSYCAHDVTETKSFAALCRPLIDMRRDLLDKGILSGDVLNFSDVKIGTEYLIKKIGRSKCFVKGSQPKQTFRSKVEFKDVILPKIHFRTEKFQMVLDWFKTQTIYIAEGATRPSLKAELAGLQFDFGVGGVHASAESKVFESNAEYVIKDIDVSGMYVAVGIANGFSPEHLGKDFTEAYKGLQRDRAQYPKGSTMNAVMKLAGNGVYGNSNNPYSCFYDPKYTFSVTTNGQLQLLQLVEMLSLIPGLEIIQVNTDGITALVPRAHESFFILWRQVWEQETSLTLEEVTYSKMWIRDVNNYVALTDKGKLKQKGAYWYPKSIKEYEGWWNKDFSSLAVQKGVELCMLYSLTPEQALSMITDPFDYMLRYKTTGDAKVYIGNKKQLRTVRYYISRHGEPMRKVASPKGNIGAYKRRNGITDGFFQKISLEVGTAWDERIHTKNKSRYAEVTTAIQSGRLVKECNLAATFQFEDLDYDYYVQEIKKLLIGVK